MPDRHGPYRNTRYLLEIDGIVKAGFSQATIPNSTTQITQYREGNDPPTARKLGGLNQYADLTLQWGTTSDSIELFEWKQLAEQGNLDAARRNVAVIVLDEEGEPGPRWEFRNAWPTQYDAPDLNATGTDVAVESVTITHEGMERTA